MDATLLEAWAGLKSFRPKGKTPKTPPDDPGNPTVDFHGERLSNDTHQSTTDPDARLYRKGTDREAKLCYMGHVVIENRHGLVVQAQATTATGTAEAETAVELIEQLAGDPDEESGLLAGSQRPTVGADKAFDPPDFVGAMRDLNITPHVAQKMRDSAIDGRTTRHPGYALSQTFRKRVEESFGWLKTVGLMRKLRHRGAERVDWVFVFTTAIYNLVRLRTLLTVAAA